MRKLRSVRRKKEDEEETERADVVNTAKTKAVVGVEASVAAGVMKLQKSFGKALEELTAAWLLEEESRELVVQKQSRVLLDEKETEVLRLFKGLESDIHTCGIEGCQLGHIELV